VKRKRIEYDTPIKVSFTPRERELILEHTSADLELTDRLAISIVKDRRLVAKYTLDDLDALGGYVAAEANHCKDRKLQKELYELFGRLQKTMEGYDDGAWQEAF